MKIRYNQKKLLLIFFPTIILWLFGGKISMIMRIPLDFYRTEVIGLAAVILLFVFHVLDWDDVRKIRWEIFLLVGGGLTLGQILIDSGAASLMAGKFYLIFRNMPVFIVLFAIVVLSIILTNFVNNSSSTIILVPVLIQLGPMLSINPKMLAITAAMATAISTLTPIAMPSFSLIYGTGKVTRKEMIKTGFYISLICSIILTSIIFVMGKFIY